MTDNDALGGRLPLLPTDRLTDAQRAVHEALSLQVGPEAKAGGFVAGLDDGRLIGPFNAMLRTPDLTGGFGRWVEQIGATGLEADVREAVILTIGGYWAAAYEIYAHRSAAQSLGMSADAVRLVVAGEPAPGLSMRAEAARRMTSALLRDRRVRDDMYAWVVDELGIEQSIAVLHLVAQYQLISSLLVLFAVPAPDEPTGGGVHDRHLQM